MDLDLFRLTRKQAKRQLRSKLWFRDPGLAIVEIDDPAAPGKPFFCFGSVDQVEATYGFKRNHAPAYLKLFVGANARQRLMELLTQLYDLDPQERVSGLEKISPPVNDDPDYVCLIEYPERNPAFFGHRLSALTSSLFRPMFFMDGPTVFHGDAAIERMRKLLPDVEK
jgi:hypothetical protein